MGPFTLRRRNLADGRIDLQRLPSGGLQMLWFRDGDPGAYGLPIPVRFAGRDMTDDVIDGILDAGAERVADRR